MSEKDYYAEKKLELARKMALLNQWERDLRDLEDKIAQLKQEIRYLENLLQGR